jgi:hypothetical protein
MQHPAAIFLKNSIITVLVAVYGKMAQEKGALQKKSKLI